MQARALFPVVAAFFAAFTLILAPQNASAQKSGPLSPMWSRVVAAGDGVRLGDADTYLDPSGYTGIIFGVEGLDFMVVLSPTGRIVASGRIETEGNIISFFSVTQSWVVLTDYQGNFISYAMKGGSLALHSSRSMYADDDDSDEFVESKPGWDRYYAGDLRPPSQQIFRLDYNETATRVRVTRFRSK